MQGVTEGLEISPTSAGLQSLPGGLQPGSACPARAAGSLIPMGQTQGTQELFVCEGRWHLCKAHLALSDTQPWSDPHRGGRMDKIDPKSLCPSLAVIRLGVLYILAVKVFLTGSLYFLFFR